MRFSPRVERLRGAFLAGACLGVFLGAAPSTGLVQLDSQLVLGRYLAALGSVKQPPYVVFSYRVSQAGAHNIEQTHRIFRGGSKERDETVSVEGDPVKTVQVVAVDDRYAVGRLAPRTGAYTFLFLQTRRHGKHLDYVYATEPLTPSNFTMNEVVVDGESYLPSLIRFTSVARGVHASGSIAYAKAGRYWMPIVATAAASIGGHPTRERLAWSGYSFPSSLPPATFIQPKALTVPKITASPLPL